MSSGPPIGKPYSHIYVERRPATEDSARFRGRLAAYLRNRSFELRVHLARALREELGVRIDPTGLGEFFEECSLRDLLDSITHVARAVWGSGKHPSEYASEWLSFVHRVLNEESIGYRLDAQGGVHPAVDEEFEVQRSATIATLEGARYVAVLNFFKSSIDSLKHPPNTRDAVRHCFEAVENLVKLMVPVPRLTPNEVEKQIKPLVLAVLSGTERNAANLMLNGLAAWVAACQQYRHAAGQEEPDAPSLELALWMISDGAAHLRWLASADKRLAANSKP